jgi:hypothetical protein
VHKSLFQGYASRQRVYRTWSRSGPSFASKRLRLKARMGASAVPAGLGSYFVSLPRTYVRGCTMPPLRGWGAVIPIVSSPNERWVSSAVSVGGAASVQVKVDFYGDFYCYVAPVLFAGVEFPVFD